MSDWTPFYNPMTIRSAWQIWLMLPLCVSVAVIYKTVRVGTLRNLWVEILSLVLYIVTGIAALAAGVWLFQLYWK